MNMIAADATTNIDTATFIALIEDMTETRETRHANAKAFAVANFKTMDEAGRNLYRHVFVRPFPSFVDGIEKRREGVKQAEAFENAIMAGYESEGVFDV